MRARRSEHARRLGLLEADRVPVDADDAAELRQALDNAGSWHQLSVYDKIDAVRTRQRAVIGFAAFTFSGRR